MEAFMIFHIFNYAVSEKNCLKFFIYLQKIDGLMELEEQPFRTAYN